MNDTAHNRISRLFPLVIAAGLAFPSFRVSAAGLTDVHAILTVTDTLTGAVHTYTNLQGTPFQPIQDMSAFATCP